MEYLLMSELLVLIIRSERITNDLLFDPRDLGLTLLDEQARCQLKERQEGGLVIGGWMTQGV